MEELAFQLADARLLVGLGLRALALRVLADGESTQHDHEHHRGEVQHQGGPGAGRDRLHEGDRLRLGLRALQDERGGRRPARGFERDGRANRGLAPGGPAAREGRARGVLQEARAAGHVGACPRSRTAMSSVSRRPFGPAGSLSSWRATDVVRRGCEGSMAAPSSPVGLAETQSTGTPPRLPISMSGAPRSERSVSRTVSGWLRRKTRSALSAASRSPRAVGLVPWDRRPRAEEAARNSRLARVSSSTLATARPRAWVSAAKSRVASLSRGPTRRGDAQDPRAVHRGHGHHREKGEPCGARAQRSGASRGRRFGHALTIAGRDGSDYARLTVLPSAT